MPEKNNQNEEIPQLWKPR